MFAVMFMTFVAFPEMGFNRPDHDRHGGRRTHFGKYPKFVMTIGVLGQGYRNGNVTACIRVQTTQCQHDFDRRAGSH